MHTTTSSTLLERLKDPGDGAIWQEYVERYRPLIVGYGRKLGLGADDAEDTAQDTLLEFSKSYREGKYARRKGRLRSWLFGIAHMRVRNTMRRNLKQARPVGDDDDLLGNLPSDDELEAVWDEEWRRAIIRRCLDEVRREVQPSSVRAFELVVLAERSIDDAACELELTPNAVSCAKHRVLKRVRELLPLMEDVF